MESSTGVKYHIAIASAAATGTFTLNQLVKQHQTVFRKTPHHPRSVSVERFPTCLQNTTLVFSLRTTFVLYCPSTVSHIHAQYQQPAVSSLCMIGCL
jgi:hypothetical protein